MNISKKGIELIKKFEGLSLKAYKCPAGVWTIGFGHTANVKEGQIITKIQAESYLKHDIKLYELYVINNVPYKLTQGQFDALVSFTFNCGLKNLKTLIKKRTLSQIGNAILLYNKSGGKVLEGLKRRRQAEKELFTS